MYNKAIKKVNYCDYIELVANGLSSYRENYQFVTSFDHKKCC